MGPFPILTDDLLDTSRQQFDFTQSLTDTIGDLGTDADGFDSAVADTIAAVVAGQGLAGLLDDDLGIATGIAGLIDPNSLSDVAAALPGYLATESAIVTDTGALLQAIAPAPTPPSGGGGGGGTPTQSANCGSYGLSSILLSDPTQNCFAATTLPVVNIADGPCTFIFLMDGSSFAGKATVYSTALQSGDAQLFSISNDTVTAADGVTPVSRVLVKVSPYKVGHFNARFAVSTNRASPEVWCMILDVISQGGSGTPAPTPTPPPPRIPRPTPV